MPTPALPLPPLELATRVGPGRAEDPLDAYLREGRALRERIDRLLPAEWDWSGKRVLDFGCGSARVLRHFLPETAEAEFWGCDIDRPSIDWARANVDPPFHLLANDYAPPPAVDSASIDLVYAMSVFTHIGDGWSDWLLELHRALKPGGLLISSFLGEGMWEGLLEEPYVEDEVGMLIRRRWTGADSWVFHSEWWLREHWGRAFEVLEVERPPRDAAGRPDMSHSAVVLRRRDVELTKADLERLDPGEPRETAALQTNVRWLKRETDELVLRNAIELEQMTVGAAARKAVRRTRLGRRAAALVRRVRGRP